MDSIASSNGTKRRAVRTGRGHIRLHSHLHKAFFAGENTCTINVSVLMSSVDSLLTMYDFAMRYIRELKPGYVLYILLLRCCKWGQTRLSISRRRGPAMV